MPDFNDNENSHMGKKLREKLANIDDILRDNPDLAETLDNEAWTKAEDDSLQREAEEILNGSSDDAPEINEELAAAYSMDTNTNGKFDPSKGAKRLYAIYQRSKSPILKTARHIRTKRGDAVKTGIKSYISTKDGFKLSEFEEEIDGLRIISARTGAGKTLTAASEATYLVTFGNEDRPDEIDEKGRTIKNKKNYVVFLSLEESYDRISARILANYAYFRGEQERKKNGSTSFVPLVPTSEEIELYIAKRYIPDRKDGVKGWTIKQRITELGEELDEHLEILSDDYFTDQAAMYKVKPLVLLNYIHNLQIGIRAIYDRFKDSDKEVLFYLDYTQLLKAESKLSRFDQLQLIMREFKDMSQHGIRIIAAAQSNRELAKKNPSVYEEIYAAQNEALRESGDIEQTASTVYYAVKDDENGELLRINLKYRGRGNKGAIACYPIDKNTSTVDFTRPLPPRRTKDGTEVPRGRGNTQPKQPKGNKNEKKFDMQGCRIR